MGWGGGGEKTLPRSTREMLGADPRIHKYREAAQQRWPRPFKVQEGVQAQNLTDKSGWSTWGELYSGLGTPERGGLPATYSATPSTTADLAWGVMSPDAPLGLSTINASPIQDPSKLLGSHSSGFLGVSQKHQQQVTPGHSDVHASATRPFSSTHGTYTEWTPPHPDRATRPAAFSGFHPPPPDPSGSAPKSPASSGGSCGLLPDITDTGEVPFMCDPCVHFGGKSEAVLTQECIHVLIWLRQSCAWGG